MLDLCIPARANEALLSLGSVIGHTDTTSRCLQMKLEAASGLLAGALEASYIVIHQHEAATYNLAHHEPGIQLARK